jgi:hypothetical protein
LAGLQPAFSADADPKNFRFLRTFGTQIASVKEESLSLLTFFHHRERAKVEADASAFDTNTGCKPRGRRAIFVTKKFFESHLNRVWFPADSFDGVVNASSSERLNP